jgi:hypothetical protein
MAVVHISGPLGQDEVDGAAIKKFERDRGIPSWKRAADGYELLDPD